MYICIYAVVMTLYSMLMHVHVLSTTSCPVYTYRGTGTTNDFMEMPKLSGETKPISLSVLYYACNVCYLAYCRDPVDAIQTASNEAYHTVEGGQGEGDAVYEMLPDPPSDCVPPSTSHPSQTTAGDSLYEPV